MKLKPGDTYQGQIVESVHADGTVDLRDAAGVVTRSVVVEATSPDSLDGRREKVSCAVRERFCKGNGLEPAPYVYAREVFDTYVIIAKDHDDLYRVDYTIDAAGEVQFGGEPVPVKVVYEPVQVAEALTAARAAGFDGCLLGAVRESAEKEPDGSKWDAVLIRAGLSANRNFYSRAVLEAAVQKYEGARVYINHSEEPRRFGRGLGELAGFVQNVRGVLLGATEGAGAEGDYAIVGTVVVTKKAVREELMEANRHGRPDLFGLSHDVKGTGAEYRHSDGERAYRVDEIKKVESVDFVTTPAAGGHVRRMVAAVDRQVEEDGRMLTKLLEQLRALAPKVAAKLGDAPTEEQVIAALSEALREAPARTDAAPAAAVREATTPAAAPDPTLQEARGLIASLRVDQALTECALPDKTKARLRERMAARITAGQPPTADEIREAIREKVEELGELAEAGLVLPHVGQVRVQMLESAAEKTKQRMNDFFDAKKPAQSFREMYLDITGDKHFTGRADRARLSESLNTASFDQAMGDSITRQMLAYYALPDYANWRAIARTTRLNDFRTQRRIRFGGYANLPTVGQGAPYLALTSPTDEEATYAPAKRGGTESVTLEMIRNDDVSAIREIPARLGRAAGQTMYEFVWDFLRTNAAIYDATALAAAGHNNIVTTAMSWSNVASLRLKMKQQADMSNGKRLGLRLRTLCVPSDLEELAYQLQTSDRVMPDSSIASTAAAAAPNFGKKVNFDVIVVDYWTDANDYWACASPDQTPMVEIGFLDGREEPEIFVQDLPNVGSMFNNDMLTWKLRHVYGGAVQDFRGFAAGIVP